MTTESTNPAMPRVRYRINVNRLAKGQLSFDCTVELDGPVELLGEHHDVPCSTSLYQLRKAALEESDTLVAELRIRYPMVLE